MRKDVLYLCVVRSSVWLGYRLQGWNDERVRLRCFNKILWLKECKILLLSHVAVLREVVRMARIV